VSIDTRSVFRAVANFEPHFCPTWQPDESSIDPLSGQLAGPTFLAGVMSTPHSAFDSGKLILDFLNVFAKYVLFHE